MSTLDRIIQMQNQGMSETQISRQLQTEGINPKEINNAFNQAQVKNAVSENNNFHNRTDGMQPSMNLDQDESGLIEIPDTITEQENPQYSQTQLMQKPNQRVPEIYPPQNYGQQQYTDDTGYYQQTPQPYQQDYYMPPTSATDTDTIAEIAEQVVSEKFSEFHKKTGDLVTFKNSTQDKVSDLDARLKRIEETIDKLQQAIIGKIGEFGENSALVHKDLDNLHSTMSKLMNPLIDNYTALKKIAKD